MLTSWKPCLPDSLIIACMRRQRWVSFDVSRGRLPLNAAPRARCARTGFFRAVGVGDSCAASIASLAFGFAFIAATSKHTLETASLHKSYPRFVHQVWGIYAPTAL